MEPACGCPRLNEADRQSRKHVWGPRAFYRTRHGHLFHMPIGIAGAIRKGVAAIKAKGYTIKAPCMMLDDETGLLSADMLIALKETPENDPNAVVWEAASGHVIVYPKGMWDEGKRLVFYANGNGAAGDSFVERGPGARIIAAL